MTPTKFPYHYPCAHDTKGLSISCDCDEYHPLTTEDAITLLGLALTREWHEKNSIQCRFVQAIKGMRCPHPIEGEVAEKMAKMDKAYVEYVRSGGQADYRSEILGLIN